MGGNSTSDARDLVAQLNEKIAGLSNLVDRLQDEVTQLKSRTPRVAVAGEGAAAIESEQSLDRRRMLKGAGLAAAAGAAALVVVGGKATPAGALNPSLMLDQTNNATAGTELTSSASIPGVIFVVNDTQFTPNSSSYASALGGWAGGSSNTDVGVYGYSEQSNDGTPVAGAAGAGMVAYGSGANTIGIYAKTAGGEAGVLAETFGPGRAIIARTDGTGQGIWSHLTNAGNTKDSVRADTSGPGSGIFASSTLGAGGKFQGKTCAIQLVPSTATSHPASGSAGQLFVDKSNRLWYCRGGSNWAQLA